MKIQVERRAIEAQPNYQKANAALYQYEIANGTDPDLKAFAQETLPKIEDHLARALGLHAAIGTTGRSDG